jgi:hypothetical protein
VTGCLVHVGALALSRAYVSAQSDDPGRDFRGAGLYGLDNLMYMGTFQPALFKQLMLKTQVRQEGIPTPS